MNDRTQRRKIFLSTAKYLALLSPLLLIVILIYIATRPDIPDVLVRCDADTIRRGQPLVRLSDAQCQAIGHAVAIGNRSNDTRMGAHRALRNILKVGDAPPETMDLQALPEAVLNNHPSLSKYRYFIVEDEIALTDPNEQKIVAFVEVHAKETVNR